MNFFRYDKNSTTLSIDEYLSNFNLDGSKNKVYIKANVANLIINGHHNKIISHLRQGLSNVIINGSNNNITAPDRNFNQIVNGFNNTINNESLGAFNMYNNFRNSSFNININNCNAQNFSAEIQNFINLVTNLSNSGNHQQRNYSFNRNINNEYYNNEESEEEEDEEYENEDEEEEQEEESANEDEERRQRELMNKKKKRILELNEFQFKNAKKYIERIEDQCAICKEKFKGTDIVKQFSCQEHIFHKKCLMVWLKLSNLCPLCREDIMKD